MIAQIAAVPQHDSIMPADILMLAGLSSLRSAHSPRVVAWHGSRSVIENQKLRRTTPPALEIKGGKSANLTVDHVL